MCKRDRGRKFSFNPKLLEQMQEKTAAAAITYEALRQEREGKKKDNKTKK